MLTLASFFIPLALTAGVPGLILALALRPWRRLPEEPWMERARQLHPIRRGHMALTLILPFTAVVLRMAFWPKASLAAVLLGSIFGCTLSGWFLDHTLFPDYRFRAWLRASLTLSALRLGWVFLILFFALSMPNQWSLSHFGWAGAFLIAGTVLSAGVIYRLLAVFGTITPAGERLTSLVRACSAETQTTVSKAWELPSPAGYAAALPFQRALIFSTTTVAEHSDDELRAICRHELAHLREGPALVTLRTIQVPLLLLPFIFIPTTIATLGPMGILPPLFLWLLLNKAFLKISLRLEKRADAAARPEGESPVYARALERLYRRNLIPASLAPKAARTHPDLYDRMVAAGVTPDYPRPAPPPELHWIQVAGHLLNAATMICWLASAK